MVSVFTPNKGHLEEPANGDYANTWNVPVNSNWSVIDSALGGTTLIVLSNVNVTLTTAQYQNMRIGLGGTLTGNVTISIPATIGGFWIISNATSGAFTVFVNTTAGGSLGTYVPQGYSMLLYSDGTNVQPADNGIVSSPSVSGSLAYYHVSPNPGNIRWVTGLDGSAETGGNAGSNWITNRYDDTGAYLSAWLTVTRSTGAAQINGNIGINKAPSAFGLDVLGSINTGGYAISGVGLPNSFGGYAKKCIVTNGGVPNTQVAVTAEYALLSGALGGVFRSSISLTISTGASGVNGLDTGTIAANTWYYAYIIDNGTTTAGILSASPTVPVLPGGYVFYTRVGSVKTDGTSSLYRSYQAGCDFRWKVTAATNTAALPIIVNGNVGDTSIPTWGVATVRAASGLTPAAVCPPTAKEIAISASVYTTGGGSVKLIVAPNNAYGPMGSNTNPPPIQMEQGTGLSAANATSTLSKLLLENDNIYVAASILAGTTGVVAAYGFTDTVNAS